MAWFKVDDRFTFHPKVLTAGNEAIGAWVRLGAYCGAHLTDGKLPAAIVLSVCGKDVAAQLVAIHFLDHAPDGSYSMHDYLEYNPSAAQVRAERAATAERVARMRGRNGSSNGVTNTVGNGSPDPIPIPTLPDQPNQPDPAAPNAWLAVVFEKYPRKTNAIQERAVTAVAALSDVDRQAFTKAVSAYARQVVVEKTPPRYVTTWAVFCESKWRDYAPVEKPKAKAFDAYELEASPPPKALP